MRRVYNGMRSKVLTLLGVLMPLICMSGAFVLSRVFYGKPDGSEARGNEAWTLEKFKIEISVILEP